MFIHQQGAGRRRLIGVGVAPPSSLVATPPSRPWVTPAATTTVAEIYPTVRALTISRVVNSATFFIVFFSMVLDRYMVWYGILIFKLECRIY
jgi:hypothetical protein